MRIGFVIINLGNKGGAEKRFFNIINSLADQHQVYFLTNNSVLEFGKELEFNFENICIDILIKDKPGSGQNNRGIKTLKKNQPVAKKIIKRLTSKKFRGFIRELYKVIKYNFIILFWAKRNRLDVINSLQASGIYTISSAFTKTKTVYSYMDYEVKNGYPFYWIKNMGLKTVFKFSDKYDFLSSMIPEVIESKGLKLDKKKIQVAPNSFVDYDRITVGEKDPKRIVFSGRIEMVKNPILAVEVADILNKKGVHFELFMLGKGSLGNDIKNLIKKFRLTDRVHVYFEQRVEKILANSSIYLSLQNGNNYPSQALLEAMAAENVPICTDVGETRLLVDESVGFLVGFDAVHISNIVEHLINNKSECRRIGKKARQKVIQTHNIQSYNQYLMSLYQN